MSNSATAAEPGVEPPSGRTCVGADEPQREATGILPARGGSRLNSWFCRFGDGCIDANTIRQLIADWIAHRDAAATLLVSELKLESPREVLDPEHRGRRVLSGTGWSYRTHGIGVDVTRTNGHGGIDFDFSTQDGQLFKPPDFWRLVLFAKRSAHDRTIDSAKYKSIIDNAERYRDLIEAELEQQFRT